MSKIKEDRYLFCEFVDVVVVVYCEVSYCTSVKGRPIVMSIYPIVCRENCSCLTCKFNPAPTLVRGGDNYLKI